MDKLRKNFIHKAFYSLATIIVLLLVGCEKELPVEPKAYESKIYEVNLGPQYESQYYFDLEQGSSIAQFNLEDWDIIWNNDSCYILLNSAKIMKVAKIPSFSEAVQPDSLYWYWDSAEKHWDGSAIGEWWKYNNSYLIDLGYSPDGKRLGYIRFKPQECADSIKFRFASLDMTYDTTVAFPKPTEPFAFSFINKSLLTAIPTASDYDLLFTRYTHKFILDNGDTMAYGVVGALLSKNCSASLDTIHTWEEISSKTIAQLKWDSRKNAIGYDWKYYDFDNSKYVILPNRIYIIKNRNGFYFKLQFIDFYSPQGEKGYIKFRLQQL